eukprot:CAMPEP_0178377458 /NCGR_PEP_ID=MMETSP0689_2-20121128/3928_1 /TAXON_ID=160604 /ORGANISM="Amphidinium massartii, Strain CS-259" /LENGTH=203 /DNA_ID=CAMNT_0019997511 /DNA_START=68 /DNA_END=676 /DNA_ORIENTATION=+
MEPRHAAYSVWMCPPADQGEKMHSLIKDLAVAFNAPAFSPHVTLLGNAPKGSEEDAKVLVAKLAANLQPFEVQVLAEISFQDTWNQNVLLFAEESEELLAANSKAKEVLRGEPQGVEASFAPPSRRPHMSLIYGDHSTERRELAVSWVKEKAPWAVEGFKMQVSEIQLWGAAAGFTAASVPDWYHVASSALGHDTALAAAEQP